MKQDYQKTMYACFIGYIVQAVVNSFVPLLFVTFQNTYHIPLSQITLLITINFVVQLCVDLLVSRVRRQNRLPGIYDSGTHLRSGRNRTADSITGDFTECVLPESCLQLSCMP